MAEITKEVVFSQLVNKTYFSEEEFPQVPKLLVALIKEEKITVMATLEWALQQAESLNKDEVFLVCLLAAHRAKPQLSDKAFEAGKPIKLLDEVAARMMNGTIKNGGYDPVFQNYKELCGLVRDDSWIKYS